MSGTTCDSGNQTSMVRDVRPSWVNGEIVYSEPGVAPSGRIECMPALPHEALGSSNTATSKSHGAIHAVRPTWCGPTMLSLIHISEPTRLGMISYAVFCL